MEGVTWLYIYDHSSVHGWRKITDYGSIERACIILTNIGGSKNLGIVLQDCKAVSDNRGNRPRIEGLGQ